MIRKIFPILLTLLLMTSLAFAGIDERLKLHANGADTSTTFTDDSGQGHTTSSVVATCELDTSWKKWGTASIEYDGDSGYFTYADSADWDISTNFTIDFQVKHDTHAASQFYFQHFEDAVNKWSFYHRDGSGLRFYIYTNGFIVDTGFGGEIDDIDEHHLAVCKVGNEYGIYKDGIQVAHTSDSDIDAYTGTLFIGSTGNPDDWFDGHMDEIRINHDNPFGAAPVAELTDTIDVPLAEDNYGTAVAAAGQVIFINED